MRLIECYIENFGKLHDFRYTFNEGLNVFHEENGYGKTTLSVFIKAMFYGLDDTKRTKLEENDRKHYLPWQGGVCGGWLTFTTGPLGYRVERTFGAKASDDTYTLYELETGKLSHAYRDGLGERIFGIDADGFERTLFLSERKLAVQNENKSVSAKLSDLVGCDFDLGELDNALDVLEERRKYYYKKGGAGKISDIKSQIADIDAEISRIKRISDTIEQREKKLSDFTSEIAKCELALTEYSTRARVAEGERLYIEKRAALSGIKEKLAEVKKFFSAGVPTKDEIDDAERASDQIRILKSKLDGMTPDAEKKDELSEKIKKCDEHIAKLKSHGDISKRKSMPIPLFVLTPVLAAVGVIITATLSIPFGVILIALAAISLTASVALGASASAEIKAQKSLLADVKSYLDKNGKSYVGEDAYLNEIILMRSKAEAELTLLLEKEAAGAEDLKKLSEAELKLNTFLARFPSDNGTSLATVKEMKLNYEHLGWRTEDMERELESFALANGINKDKIASDETGDKEILNVNPIELKIKLDGLRKEQSVFENEYRAMLEEVGRLDELNERHNELSDELATSQSKLNTIVLTREHLVRAKDRLTAKYLGKTRALFDEYIKLLSTESPELFGLSVNFGISKSAGSTSKPTEAFSLGTRELYSLAARLALTDSLYDGNRPFIILDDPFAHFDDKRCAMATKAVKKLADMRQIIYFTCSKSRTV